MFLFFGLIIMPLSHILASARLFVTPVRISYEAKATWLRITCYGVNISCWKGCTGKGYSCHCETGRLYEMALHQELPMSSDKYLHNSVTEYKVFLLLLKIKPILKRQQMLFTNWRSWGKIGCRSMKKMFKKYE